MNVTELYTGCSVLIQRGPDIERATVKVFLDNGKVVVRLLNGQFTEVAPEQILRRYD